MLKWIFLISALALATPAWAVTCQPNPGPSGWSWRLIDGKKCWYKGPPGMEKVNLRWVHKAHVLRRKPMIILDRDGNFIHTPGEKRLLESYWP